jgi:hypothetical protein
MKKWHVIFAENGDEYEGWLNVTANDVVFDINNPRAITADGVYIEIDERIISITPIYIVQGDEK